MSDTQKPWINKGYRVFALEGPTGLKVERLARSVGRNKSSFYHHFADSELFIELLLDHHLEQAMIMGEKEKRASDFEGLIAILVEHKVDLLFNRQLRIHRENPEFQRCFTKTNEIVGASILALWSRELGLSDNSYLARLVLKLSMENFFLQITDETLNKRWLHDYFAQLRMMVKEFRNGSQAIGLDDPA